MANLWLPAGARLNFLNSAVIDIMIKTIRAIKSNCKSLLIAEENFVIKEQSEQAFPFDSFCSSRLRPKITNLKAAKIQLFYSFFSANTE